MQKFSVRDLFWLVLEHRELARLRHDMAERNRAVRPLAIDMTGASPSPFSFSIGFAR